MENETTILWAELSVFPSGWSIKNHLHNDYYHLFFFTKGTGTFLIGNESHPIVSGSGFLLPPSVSHGLAEVENDELIAYELKFRINDPNLRDLLQHPCIFDEKGDFFKTCITYICEHGLSPLAHRATSTNHYLCALLEHLSGETVFPEEKNSELIDTSPYSEVTIHILTYVENNYMTHFYLDEIAATVEYNRNYMCLLFKNDTGITIVDYLNYVRIRKACEYILYSDISLSQISSRVGFTNLSHFNRTFKKLVGNTPSVYKRIANIDDHNLISSNSSKGALSSSRFPSLEQAMAALRIDGY